MYIPNFDPGWATLFGGTFVMAAAIIAIKGNDSQRRADLEERKKSVRQAIGYEIAAITRLLKERGYVDQLQDAARQYALGGLPGMAHYKVFYIPADRNYVRVYEANLGNIAFLGKQTLDVVEFYAMVESALDVNQTLKEMAKKVTLAPGSSAEGELAQSTMNVLASNIVLILREGEKLARALCGSDWSCS